MMDSIDQGFQMMDIIDQGFQTPLLQQIDQQQAQESNLLGLKFFPKYPTVAGLPKGFQKRRNKFPFEVKHKENVGSCLKASGLNVCTSSLLLDGSGINSSAILATDSLNANKTVKGKSKRNKNKKKRLNKKFSYNAVLGVVEVANQDSSVCETCLKETVFGIRPNSCDQSSLCGSESIGSHLKDGTNHDRKLFSGPSLNESPVSMRGHISYNDQGTCRISGSGTKEIVEVSNRSSTEKKIVVLDGTICDPKDHKETLDVGYLLPKASHGNGKSQTGKENNHFIWQKIRKSGKYEQAHVAKNYVPVEMDNGLEEAALLRNNSLPTAGSLPSSIYASPGHKIFTPRMKEGRNSEQGNHRNHDLRVMVESPHWVSEQKCHGVCGQGFFQSRQDDPLGSKIWVKSNERLDLMFNNENTSHPNKRSWASKTRLYKLQTKVNLSQKEASEHLAKTCLYKRISDPSDQAVLHEVQQQTCMKFPRSGLAVLESLHTSLDNVEKRPACVEVQASCEDDIRDDLTSRVSLQERVPIEKKDSEVLKSSEVVDAYNDLMDKTVSCAGEMKNVEEEHSSLCSLLSSFLDDVNSSSYERIPGAMGTRITTGKPEKPGNHREGNYRKEINDSNVKDISLSFIGSQKIAQALHASYRLQIASENVHLATGNLLAEFERVLHSVSPVVVPASNLQNCEVCMENRLIHNSFCNQVPKIQLGAVWNWYEKSGSYGLEVLAEDPPNLNRLNNDAVLFHAHFVPFLSAVQLFSHSQPSQHSCIGNLKTKMPENAITGIENSSFPCLRDAPMSASDLSASDGDGSFDLTPILACPNELELVFEYFESEQPQQRRPLFDKIMELIKVGTSNCKVYGDPLKLECMDLHDLHPASWYSVAWYPIYRIPEGNFRASFLTYHSLGNFVHRCTSLVSFENAFCVVSPVVGLESYNAQGECWFLPRKTLGSSHESLLTSKILKERLRTLEETASLLARGHVLKDNIEVVNRQPDYEFFLSRKH